MSSVPDTIQEAEVKYPDIALKLLPSSHLNKLETGVATVRDYKYLRLHLKQIMKPFSVS